MRVLVILLGAVCMASCASGPKELEQAEYISWFKDNQEAKQQKQIRDVHYSLTYVPAEYVMLNNHRKDLEQMRIAERDSLLAEYKTYDYFIYQIAIDQFREELAKYKLNTEAAYYERVDYYAFRMQDDLKMVSGKGDTLPCVVYHFERNYGVSPENRFLIGFKKPTTNEDRTVIVDNKYLESGPVKFTVTADDIQKTPSLKFNS